MFMDLGLSVVSCSVVLTRMVLTLSQVKSISLKAVETDHRIPTGQCRQISTSNILIHLISRGADYAQGSLNWGPADFLNGISKTFGVFTEKRKRFDNGFHTYVLEWTDKFLSVHSIA
jgi:hypothetical protein